MQKIVRAKESFHAEKLSRGKKFLSRKKFAPKKFSRRKVFTLKSTQIFMNTHPYLNDMNKEENEQIFIQVLILLECRLKTICSLTYKIITISFLGIFQPFKLTYDDLTLGVSIAITPKYSVK